MEPLTIDDACRARGWTQDELALVSGISLAMISRIRRGIAPLSPQCAERLGRALDVAPAALMAGQEKLRRELREELLARVKAEATEAVA